MSTRVDPLARQDAAKAALPYEKSRSASKIGSSTSIAAVMHTRSRRVEMPSGLSLPLAFGMNTLLMGSGRYVSSLSASASSPSHRPPLHAVRLDIREVLTVHTRRALVGAALDPGMGQNI